MAARAPSSRPYPRLDAYIASLPNGLLSHPECVSVAEVLVEFHQAFPDLGKRPDLPPELGRYLGRTWEVTDEVPEAVNIAARVLVRDAMFDADDKYLEFIESLAAKVFAKPMYRMLMYVMSPTLVLMGAQKRWARFRRGTVLQASPRQADGTVDATLTYPHNLFPTLALEGFGRSYRAALRATGAKNVRVTLGEHGATLAHYAIAWD